MNTVGLQRIWAPWRAAFLEQGPSRGCIFCHARRSRSDDALHMIYRGRRVFSLLNKYPYNVGHLMVAPNRHVGDLSRLTSDELRELMEVGARMVERLKRTIKPQGFNLGINLGRVAGAGIPGHVHLHVVPRWKGDTNFMSATGNARVMSHSLDAMYQALMKPPVRRKKTR